MNNPKKKKKSAAEEIKLKNTVLWVPSVEALLDITIAIFPFLTQKYPFVPPLPTIKKTECTVADKIKIVLL